jgi:N-acetylmuramoyl-L-alanine amidase
MVEPIASWRRYAPAALALVLLAACGGTATSSPVRTPMESAGPPATAEPTATPAAGAVEPAPGSDSAVYAPNPTAIVVAVDAGHGGCLDWGVPDPSQRGQAHAEETMTLEIARRVRDKLEAEGITVVMIRDEDEALAGDDYPPLDCHGPAWRDANGDGHVGFGDDRLPVGTRTRDELQARLDVANLAMADALVSIHINSPTQDGQVIEIAFTETFYTDETPWGVGETERLARTIQDGLVAELGAVAAYERGDRGITAHNFYMVAPPLFETTAERPDPLKQPTRGGLMPVVLTEVGSITLRAEHDLLVSAEGQEAAAVGIVRGLGDYFAARRLAARIGLAAAPVGDPPEQVPGEGPPFWAPPLPDGSLDLRVTNTGTAAWADGAQLVAGWEASEQPYLRRAPAELEPIGPDLPALAPGESVVVTVDLPSPPGAGRAVAWISLAIDGAALADRGSPALQLSTGAP